MFSLLASAFVSLLILAFSASLYMESDSFSKQRQQEPLHIRTYFHVGGRYVNVSTPSYGTGTILTEQIYVEKLTPSHPTHPYSIILWTGLGNSGANWLNTPDGRPGWSSYFLSRGYTVYIADQPIRGRSPVLPDQYNDANTQQSIITSSYVSQHWTGTQHVPNPPWPQARLHSQWPGTGLPGDSTFENFVASLVPSLLNQTLSEQLSRKALSALLERTGPAFLVTHSAGGPHGWVAADDHPELVKGVVAIEPQGPPFVNQVIKSSGSGVVRRYGITQTEIGYDPPLTDGEELSNVTIPSG